MELANFSALIHVKWKKSGKTPGARPLRKCLLVSALCGSRLLFTPCTVTSEAVGKECAAVQRQIHIFLYFLNTIINSEDMTTSIYPHVP